MKSSSGQSGSSSRARLRMGDTGDGFDSALADRVRLYLKITFLVNAAVVAVAAALYFGGVDPAASESMTTVLVVGLSTVAVNGMAWFLIARSRPRASFATLAASVVTLIVSANYTCATVHYEGDPNPTRSIFFVQLLVTVVLVLRASLIPSPAFTTAFIGLLSFVYLVFEATRVAASEQAVFLTWTVVTSLVVVAVTTVTSHTIYGLQRRMRAAAQLGRYQIERLLGRGGMGEVYLAQHALLQRPTAIKLLRDVSAAANRDLFRQEVQIASGLSHPNTVEIYDYGRTPEGVFYFAMEYVEGATLEDIVHATGAMPPARVVHILSQAAGSLGEVHDRGLVHRDIKPSNLMLCERGGIHDTLKVMDFGLVHDLADGKGTAETGLSGTPLYLAPEAILEGQGAVPQTDVYALGATAYFLLTGSPPFADGNLVEILSDHLATEPPALDCDDPALATLVRRCLSKEPTDRPADAKEFTTELEACGSFGKWKQGEAKLWWAEHQEVVAAYRPAETSPSGTRSKPRSILGGTWRRSRRLSS